MPENTHKSSTTVLMTAFILLLLLGGTMFLCLECFMDKELLPKQYCFLAGIAAWLLITALFNRGKIRIPVSCLTVLFILFAGYILFRDLFSPINIGIGYTAGILVLFLLCLNIPEKTSRHINLLIVCLCIFQGVYGLVEYAGMNRLHPDTPIQGSFDNPAGFACCVAVGYPFCLFYLHAGNGLKWFGTVAIGIIGLSVTLSESRTGILMLVAATILFYSVRYKQLLWKFKKTFIPVSVLVLILLAETLFYYKPESALGRFAIWQNTMDLISDNLAFGGGNGYFLSDYMPCQAAYFSANPDSEYAQLASNVYHPFNEYLLLTAEYGLAGLLMLAALVFVILKYGQRDAPYILIVISAGAGALFSYISWYPYVWVVVVYALAKLSRRMPVVKIATIRHSYVTTLCLVLFSGFAWLLRKDIGFEYHWKITAAESLAGYTRETMPEYEKLHARWNGNPFFLYNYGAELNYIKDYAGSQTVFAICRKYLDSYDVRLMQADNYFHRGEWPEAEACYTEAANMCPNRFIPLTGLLDVFIGMQDTAAADSIARKILAKRIKIHSNITTDAINKAKDHLHRAGS